MLRYEYINQQWRARVVYRTVAALSPLLIPVLGVAFGAGMLGPLRPTLRPLLLVGVLGMGGLPAPLWRLASAATRFLVLPDAPRTAWTRSLPLARVFALRGTQELRGARTRSV